MELNESDDESQLEDTLASHIDSRIAGSLCKSFAPHLMAEASLSMDTDWTLLKVTKPSPSEAILSTATTCPPTSSTLLGTGNEDEHDDDPARRCSASNIVRRLIMTKGEEPPSALHSEAEISRGTPSSHPSDQSGSSLARTIDPELATVLAESGFTTSLAEGGFTTRHITDLPAEVAELFCVPERDAAHYLGKSLTALKKLCRQHNLKRWPYRKARISRADIIFAQTHALCVCVVCEGTPHHTSAFNAHGMAHFLCAAQGGCQDKLGHKHPSEGARSCAAVSTLRACSSLRTYHTRLCACALCAHVRPLSAFAPASTAPAPEYAWS